MVIPTKLRELTSKLTDALVPERRVEQKFQQAREAIKRENRRSERQIRARRN